MGERATIWLQRKGSALKLLVTYRVDVDGVAVGRIRNGKTLAIEVEPGPHVLQLHAFMEHSNRLEVQAEPGGELEVCCQSAVSSPRLWFESWRSGASAAPAPAPTSAPAATARSAPSPSPRRAPAPAYLTQVVESERSEEPIGDETRVIDNLHSDAQVTRSMKVTKEWTMAYHLEAETDRVRGGGLQLGPAWAGVKAQAEETVRQTYGISGQTRQLYEEQITVTVQARQMLRLDLQWKRILQRGNVRVLDGEGRTVSEMPFEVVVGVTFDQRQTEQG